MNPSQPAERAIQWVEQLIVELTGIRNATARDPSFKNWRQNTLTVMQRIWPGDQMRSERFRRIPFSPADPRADARTLREWYSRGCQEAARLLTSFLADIRARGVPEMAPGTGPDTVQAEFQDDFPTVDLPSGELSPSEDEAVPAPARTDMPPVGADPLPPGLRFDTPPGAPPAAAHPASASTESRPTKKGLGVAAKLRDLLGFAGLSAKALTGPLLDAVSPLAAKPAAPQLPKLDILPVGEEITPPARRTPGHVASSPPWPKPHAGTPAPPPVAGPSASSPTRPSAAGPPTPGVTRGPDRGVIPAVPERPESAAPSNEGASVVMSRPTTLRSSIEKVSIESLISPAFRGGAEGSTGTPAAHSTGSAPPPAPAEPASSAPSTGSVSPSAPTQPTAATPPTSTPGKPPLSLVPPPSRGTKDTEETSGATDDFVRTSPVLGATGRKVQRHRNEHGYLDPDAIAVVGMADELGPLGVPSARHPETRARLADLARRIEDDDLDWNALRTAVWFTMEYPELARRLMPLLLPWLDRAARDLAA